MTIVLDLLLAGLILCHSACGALFPYGVGNGDSTVVADDDLSYGPLTLDIPMVVFNNKETEFYVSTNGLVSFKHPFDSYSATEFAYFGEFHDTLIAPFWIDLNPLVSGSVYFRIAHDAPTINQVSDLIADSNTEFGSFHPRVVVVVTWDQVAIRPANLADVPFPHNATFQCVLATDGSNSFAFFNYKQLEMLRNVTETNEIGFNKGDGSIYSSFGIESMNETNLYRIDGACITSVLPSDACGLSAVAYECETTLRATTCLCDRDTNSSRCLDGFFPFGLRSDDEQLSRTLEGVEGPIKLIEPVKYFLKRESSIYVSTNGYLSFEAPPEVHHHALFNSILIPLIAPFWSDFDFRISGTVYYRTSQDSMLLSEIAEAVVSSNPEFDGFQPTSCVVVTWSQASLFSEVSHHIMHTFQVILASDVRSTFIIFIYEDPGSISNIITSGAGVVGFDSGDQRRSISLLSGDSNTTLIDLNVFRVDGNCITGSDPGSSCELNTTSLECISDSLIFSSCLCQAGYTASESCELENFLPFGTGDDVAGPRAVDGTTGAIQLDVPIVYYLKDQRDLYISTNGLVSFERAFNLHTPTHFPRRTGSIVPLIAPLWADFNFRDAGRIYYRVTNDSSTLDAVAEAISGRNDLYAKYKPTMAVVVTWFQSQPLGTDIAVNFQTVLVTDGSMSFVINKYGNAEAAFEGEDYSRIVGLDAGISDNSVLIRRKNLGNYLYVQTLNSNDDFIFRIDGNCATTAADDVCGMDSVPYRCFTIVPNFARPYYLPQKCLCKEGYRATENDTCLDYFHFGARAGDTLIPPPETTVRVSSHNIKIPVPMVVYGERFDILDISTEGFISFGLSSSPPIIAPLLRILPDLAPRVRNTFHYRSTSDISTLAEVTARMAEHNPHLTEFRPSLAVIITWHMYDRQLVTSVQCILSTDGEVSFAMFIYENPLEVVSQLQSREVKFDAGDGVRSRVILAYGMNTTSQEFEAEQVFRIDGECITSVGDMCALNSIAEECAVNSTAATKCSCIDGYQQVVGNDLSCVDVDECSVGTYCDQICVNTIGSAHCVCEEGYAFLEDKVTCEDIDECETGQPCDVDKQCVNTLGSFLCQCKGNGANCTAIGSSHILEGFIGASLFLTVIIVVMIVFMLYLRHLRKHRRRRPLSPLGDGEENDYYRNLRHLTVRGSIKHDIPKNIIIPSCNLQLGKTIGQGEFGIVYKGRRKNSIMDTTSEPVAIKTLKGFVQRNLVEDLLKECAKMHQFDHPNVLKLSGVCLDGGPAPYIIMPYMANGSLLSYLREERESLVLDPTSYRHDDVGEVQKKLLDMSIQVAKGMEYLVSKRVIHRDLSARNCMMDSNLVVKVADFGLSECVELSKEYFRQDKEAAIKLPVKWMSPESVSDGVFSEKSDAWSYGVTCWEVYTGGKGPYPGIHPVELPRKLDMGYRMEKPLNAACTNEMYFVMMRCWETKPEHRPTFTELVITLSSQLVAMADYMQFSPKSRDAFEETIDSKTDNGDITTHDVVVSPV